MSLKKYFFIITFLLSMQTFAFADGSAVEPRGDFRQTPGFVEAEKLNVREAAVRLEFLFEGIFNKKGDGWYTSPNGLSNVFRYNSSDNSLKNQPWKDRWGQTLFLDVAFKPTSWASAQFGLSFIADYASRYWATVNHPHRMFDEGQIFPQFSWNTAKIEVHNDWAKLQYNRNQFHYHWGYEGDLFNIYQAETDPYSVLMVTGRKVPEWYQLNMEGTFGNLELQYGEPITDYKQGFYVKYRNIYGSNINFFYVDHIIPYGEKNERMRTAEVSTDFKLGSSTLEVGGKYRPFRLNRSYDYVDSHVPIGEGTQGTDLIIKQDKTTFSDAFGGAVKLSVPKTFFVDVVTAKYLYEGLVAGNKQQLDLSAQQSITNTITGHLSYMRRKPLLQAIPARGNEYGVDLVSTRGESQPFWVWWRNPQTGFDNRDTDEFALTFTYDPTPSTWFYKYEPNTLEAWNINSKEDAIFSFATQFKLTRYLGGTDRQVYRNEKGEIVWENYPGSTICGAMPSKRYLGSFKFLTRLFLDDYEFIYDFEVGEEPSTLSAAYTPQKEAFLKEITGYFKTNLAFHTGPYKVKIGYGKNTWGPNDWHKAFGSTYDDVYYAQVSRNFSNSVIIGVDYVGGRKTDLSILKAIEEEGKSSRNELGSFDEVRTYVRLIFDSLFRLGSKPRVKGDITPPSCSVALESDIIIYSNGQRLEIYPIAYDESGIASWKITIVDDKSKIVKSFDGFGDCPQSVKWDGKNFENKYVTDGTYYIELTVSDTFGNMAKSETCKVSLITPKAQVAVEKVDKGIKFSFSSEVLFDFDKVKIKEGAEKKLKETVRILDSYEYKSLSIEGHTDDVGTDEYNLNLSRRRAEAVAEYLVKLGVDKNKISVIGHGESKPVATNETKSGRALNRRVEIIATQDDHHDDHNNNNNKK
jgi:outer membrane protein OmpA-like peptidoglycan-associated protein